MVSTCQNLDSEYNLQILMISTYQRRENETSEI